MKLIGLVGAAQAGKDTAASYLLADGWTRIAFADALKQTLYDTNPIIAVENYFTPLADVVDGYGWEWAKENTEARALLQRLGVAVRDNVHPDSWLDAAFDQMKHTGKYVITDCRFPNELAEVKNCNGILVNIVRPNHDNPAGEHISETAWHGAEFDWTVNNNLDPEYLGSVMRGIAMGL